MSTPYNGNAAGIAAHEAPVITIAQSTDLLSEEGFNVALRKLADYVAYLNANAPLLAAVNVLTQTLQLSGGDLELTKATIQALLKAGGGKLQVGTKTGNASDVELLVNGVVKAILRASDGKLQLAAQLLAQAGIDATGTGIGGPGVTGNGSPSNGPGVAGYASGASAGVLGVGASSGPGVRGEGGTNGPGVVGAANGTGPGVAGYASTGGPALFADAMSSSRGALHLKPNSAPSAPADGDMWVETGTNTLKVRINGVTKTVTLT